MLEALSCWYFSFVFPGVRIQSICSLVGDILVVKPSLS